MSEILTRRELEIFEHIHDLSMNGLTRGVHNNLGIDAQLLSLDTNYDRANISRILNTLSRKGFLLKVLGRPTRFISKSALKEYFPDTFFPEVLNKYQELIDLCKVQISAQQLNDPFSKLIGYNRDESLNEPIQFMKSALDYPEDGIPIILFGQPFTGKRELITAAGDYWQLKKNRSVVWIDVLNLNQENELFSLIMRFAQDQNDERLYIIQDFDQLSDASRQRLKMLVSNKAFYDYSNQRTHIIKGTFILITQQNMDYIQEHRYEQFIPVIVRMPNFDQRTHKERLALVVTLFQKESDRLGRTIKLNKNILNCFVLSSYEGNFDHVKTEIRSAILNHKHDDHANGPLIDLGFEHLSDDLLNRIKDVNNKIDELTLLYDRLRIQHIFIVPETPNQELVKLMEPNNTRSPQVGHFMENEILSISEHCEQDINEARSIRIDTLRSITLSEIYDLLYVTLSLTGLTHNENLLYGLLHHINNIIECIKTGTKLPAYRTDNSHEKTLSKETLQIVSTIENHINITYPELEAYFIETYIEMCRPIIDACSVSILVLCKFAKVAQSYKKFILTMNSQINVDTLDLNFFDFAYKPKIYLQELKLKVDALNQGKGVVVLSDDQIPENLETRIRDISENLVIISNITIPLLERIVNRCDNPDLFISDLKSYVPEVEDAQIEQPFDLIEMIQNELLGKSLTFLNPKKITELSFSVLTPIIKELNIDFSDILAIRFTSHTAYMVERVIRGDKLVHKKINEFIHINGKYVHIIERNFTVINDAFGITIPQSELIYLTELFLDFMQMRK